MTNKITEVILAVFVGGVVLAGADAVITTTNNFYVNCAVLIGMAYLIGKGTVKIDEIE